VQEREREVAETTAAVSKKPRVIAAMTTKEDASLAVNC
jgi:hypothetical protein